MSGLVLLTGSTGYVGGRLLTLLQQRHIAVRCLTRRPESLCDRGGETTQIVRGDVLDPQSLPVAFEGVDTAYYFVHSMGDDRDFVTQDRIAAANFAKAATAAGVGRLIYLGGLGNPDEKLSKHLRSRQETGDVLRANHSHVVEFRASIVIGSGSLSFEMIRALVERLPIMICPRWVQVKAQPIAIEDLLAYLFAALDLPLGPSQVYEIGGPDQVSYGQIMQEYARQRGLTRWMIPVPFLTPYLSSLWLGLVTPLYARVGRKLVESLRNPTLISNNLAEYIFGVHPRSFEEAIARALVNEDREFAETRWSDALSSSGQQQSWGGDRFGSRLVDSRTVTVTVPPEQAFTPILRIGGQTGWYYGNWMWRLRGWLDLLVGGVGLRRGRRNATALRVGDSVDCWRVESLEPNRRLRLFAEMRLPGRAWLQFEVEPTSNGSLIRQTAIFDPVGLTGLAYWYAIYPLHEFVFGGMLNGIADATRTSIDTETTWRPTVVQQVVWLIGFFAVCFTAAGLGAAVTATSVGGWYQTLAKPSWNPPDWLFGPVWTALYLLMAIAGWLVWRRGGWTHARGSLCLFALQLSLNVGWSAIFFGLHSPGFAFLEIVALWLAIAATAIGFARKSSMAALLLVPYLAWTSFAVVLNLVIWSLNR
jgi:tryptophan-rich sensory protein/uncharacterized protein YbjT (DUF2867 family)